MEFKTDGKFTAESIAVFEYSPHIYIPDELAYKFKYFVDKVTQQECQWLSCVTREVDEEEEVIWYNIEEMFIPEQTVTGVEVDTNDEQQFALFNEIRENNKLEDGSFDTERINFIVENMNVWSHSHVNMGVGPSKTDIDTFREKIEDNPNKIHIMLIFNKKGEVYNKVYDPISGYIFTGVPVVGNEPEFDLSYIDEAIENKIKKRTYGNKYNMGKSQASTRHHGWTQKSSTANNTWQYITPTSMLNDNFNSNKAQSEFYRVYNQLNRQQINFFPEGALSKYRSLIDIAGNYFNCQIKEEDKYLNKFVKVIFELCENNTKLLHNVQFYFEDGSELLSKTNVIHADQMIFQDEFSKYERDFSLKTLKEIASEYLVSISNKEESFAEEILSFGAFIHGMNAENPNNFDKFWMNLKDLADAQVNMYKEFKNHGY